MPKIFIHNTPYEVKASKNLLEASLALGFDLPYFCWHPALGSVGACRQCAVKVFKDEEDTGGRLVMSCMEAVREGIRFSIDDPMAKAFRQQIIEWLMLNHPHDCPVCDEGGSCHLQDMTVMTGHDYRRSQFKKRTYKNQYLGPLIHHEMNRCIQCYRCVRYYRDYAGGDDLNVFSAHDHVYFGREKDGVLQSPFSGNLAEVCPTGVFTDKTLKEHYTRKWDLTMAPSICQHCSVGCNTIAGERYGEVRCIVNRYNSEVNGYFLCDRGRFGYEYVNSENRVQQPLIRNRVGEAVSEAELMEHLLTILPNSTLIGVGSPRASVESNFMLRQLVGAENFYAGINEDDAFLCNRVVQILEGGMVSSASLKDIADADAILILGEDIWNTAPMMALAVRQSVQKTAALASVEKSHLQLWQDAAIKEWVQEEKGFLAIVSLVNTPLNEIATTVLNAAPEDAARLGYAIAHEISSSLPAVNNLAEAQMNSVRNIATALLKAKKPLIISGITNRNEGLIKSAYNIAAALHSSDRKAGIAYVMPQCNSLGLAMLRAPSYEGAVKRAKSEKGAILIVLENDLYKNHAPELVDELFGSCNSIVLDALHNSTTEKADVLIPVATFAEGDGTLVNYEGRAQRFFQVFMPSNSWIKESWKWLNNIKSLRLQTGNGQIYKNDQLLEKLEAALPIFKNISGVAPASTDTIHGERIPRAPHRYSGRTAINAGLNVSEPKPLQDNDSPLSFTMEGYKGLAPSSAIPFFWSPGWNSVQAVTKYQEEPGGRLRGGDPGLRLFPLSETHQPQFFTDVPEAFVPQQNKWILLPQHHVLGSGEFSNYSEALTELIPPPCIYLSSQDAKAIQANGDDNVKILTNEKVHIYPVKIKDELVNGIAMLWTGSNASIGMDWGSHVAIEKVDKG